MKVDVLTASCCVRKDITEKIEARLATLKQEIPDLEWAVLDIEKDPELAVRYRAPMTPAIYIDQELEIIGYPKERVLEAKIRDRAGKKG